MILPPKHATLEHILTKQPRPRTTSWRPVNLRPHPHKQMLTPTPNPPKRRRRPSLSETDESPSIDAAIDIFQKSQSSIIVSLPPTNCFNTLVQRVEETMALVDKRGISLAHRAKRRRGIVMRLSERKCGVRGGDFLPLCQTGVSSTMSLALNKDQTITKDRSTDRIQKQHFPPAPPRPKRDPATMQHYSQILRAMISEAEHQNDKLASQNSDDTSEEYAVEEISHPETLFVEKSYTSLKIRIMKAPKRAGGYIITNCRNADWMLELGVRLEEGEKERESCEMRERREER